MICRYDVGKADAYRYYNNVNGKVDQFLLDSWYPCSAVESQIFILNKIYNLAGKRDGVYVNIHDSQLSSLYLTCEYNFDESTGKYIKPSADSIRYRTKKRYDDFVYRHLILDKSINFAGLTFSGVLLLEKLLNESFKVDLLSELDSINCSLL